jgi:two-component system, LytTR family, sensor kinase
MTRTTSTLLLVAIGPLIGLVQVAGMSVEELTHGVPIHWLDHVWTFVAVSLWALFTPAVVQASAEWPLRRERLARQLLGHLALGVAISLTTAVVYLDLRMLFELAGGRHLPPRRVIDALLSGALLEDLVIYGSIVGISNAVFSYDRLRAGEVRNSQLETALVQAELQMLRSQLDPHFVFNTLNSIAALTRRDPEAAERMVSRLGDFLRSTLRGGGRQEVSLRQELDHLESYLDIQRVRFRDRLQIELRVVPAALGCLVPHLILQPLVENSIKHGMERRAGLEIRIAARRCEGRLVLEVEDDGPGPRPAPDGAVAEGVGLSITRRRLEKLYGSDQRLAVGGREGAEGGAKVSIVLPWRRADSGASGASGDTPAPAELG